MHNYNIGNRYNTSTRIGNWYEEKELDNHQFKQYLYQKDNNNNLTLNTTSKLGFSSQQVALTKSQNHSLHFGDILQFQNIQTSAVLSYNINQSILGEQTYVVTTSNQKQPSLRNAFIIQSAGDSLSGNICFGDKIRLTSTVNNRKLYLQSLPVSPMRSSKFSRHQEVSVTANFNSNSIWVIETVSAKQRFDSIGKAVSINQTILIKHLTTAQWLGSENVKYVNDFGVQYEVFGKSFLTNNKTQNLFSEKEGHKSATNPLRSQGIQNQWRAIRG